MNLKLLVKKRKEGERKEEEMSEEVIRTEGDRNKGKELMSEPSYFKTIPIPPSVPFPEKLKQLRVDKKFENLMKIFKHLHINIPFVDVIL